MSRFEQILNIIPMREWQKLSQYSPYPGCHEVRSALSDFFRSLDKGRMWWYNILGDNEGSISHLLRLDPITAGSILLNVTKLPMKRGNSGPILTAKRTERRKFIDYFGQSIDANPSKVGKNSVHFVHIGYIPRTSYVNPQKASHQVDKQLNFKPPKIRLYQLKKSCC